MRENRDVIPLAIRDFGPDRPEPTSETAVTSLYGGELIPLTGVRGLDGAVLRGELLSPLLSILKPGEELALEATVSPMTNAARITLRGIATGGASAESASRGKMLASMLAVLMRGQMPGFLFRSSEVESTSSPAGSEVTIIRPRGRRIADKRSTSEPRAQLVNGELNGVLLPQVMLSPDRLITALELMRVRGERATIAMVLRPVRFDAAALRQLTLARDAILSENYPRTSMEDMRQLVETFPDVALLTNFLNAAGGVEIILRITTPTALDRNFCRMLCHAVASVEPADHNPGEGEGLDLSSVLPNGYCIPRAISALAGCALLAHERPLALQEYPDRQGCVIGSTNDGHVVVIGDRDRARHVYVIGSIGTGKSNLLNNMLLSDIRAGKAVILLDPHGDLWEDIRRLVPEERQKDLHLVHLGDPSFPLRLNILESLGGDAAIDQSATVNELIRLFKKSLWPGVPEAFGPMWELYFRNALLLLMEANGPEASILDFERIFQDEKYRKELLQKCTSVPLKDFWLKTVENCYHDEIRLENIAPYIISKLSPFTHNALLRPALGSSTSNINFADIIKERKIVLVNLAKGTVGEGNARLVGGLLCMRLVAAVQTQMRIPSRDRQDITAYLDEFQTYATEHLTEGIEQCRKYGIRLVLANQSLGQIDGRGFNSDIGPSILANVASLISFRLGVDDARILAQWFEPNFSRDDLMYLPDYTAVGRLLVDGHPIRPVKFKTPPPPSIPL